MSMKVNVTLDEESIREIDEYAKEKGLTSRNKAAQFLIMTALKGVRLRRHLLEFHPRTQ